MNSHQKLTNFDVDEIFAAAGTWPVDLLDLGGSSIVRLYSFSLSIQGKSSSFAPDVPKQSPPGDCWLNSMGFR